MKNILTYSEILIQIKKELIKVDNLMDFSKTHKINYHVLSKIKNHELTKEYPNVIMKLYKILFNKNVTYQKVFVEN